MISFQQHGLVVFAAGVGCLAAWPVLAQDTRPQRSIEMDVTPVDLSSSAGPIADALQSSANGGVDSIRLRDGRWYVKIRPIFDFGDGVPWDIRYENHPESDIQDFPAEQFNPAEHVQRIPTLKVPNDLWDDWFDDDFKDVAGIHVPHMVRRDRARILFTTHNGTAKAQPDASSRVEASLLVPITWSIDQAIIVRSTARRPEIANRLDHEKAHAVTTVHDLVESIAGPQTWDAADGGRRSRLVWRWRYKKVYRTIEWYRGGEHKLAMLRTFVTVLPPSRWSMRLAKSKDAVTQDEVRTFNIALLDVDTRYKARREEQRHLVHEKLGAYAKPDEPEFKPRLRP